MSEDSSESSGQAGEPAEKSFVRKYVLRYEPVTRPRQVSGDELTDRWDGWREARRSRTAQRTALDTTVRRHRVWMAVCGVAVLGIAAVGQFAGSQLAATNTGHRQELDALAVEVSVAEQHAQVQSSRQTLPGAGRDEQLRDLAVQAQQAGEQVAAGQQQYAAWSAEGNIGLDGQLIDRRPAVIEQRRGLAAFFSSTTFLVSDESAYALRSQVFFDPASAIDPRYPWFLAFEGGDPKSPLPSLAYQWQVESVMPSLDSAGIASTTAVQVMWLNRRADTGQVLAWAQSTFSRAAAPAGGDPAAEPTATPGQFGTLSVTVTEQGTELLARVVQATEVAPVPAPETMAPQNELNDGD